MHGLLLGALEDGGTFDATRPDNQIEYVEESPEVRAYFREALEARGVEWNMPGACYEDPDFAF